MATKAQLDEYDRLEKEFDDEVAVLKIRRGQALPRARAQLAAAISRDESVQPDITSREGFDAENPTAVLTPIEHDRLPEATLVVNALRDYIDLTLTLKDARGPQVSRSGYGVAPGNI